MTMPTPSGSTTTMRSFGLSPSVSRANDGPRTATTPISEAEMPRYASDQAVAGLSRMYADALAQLAEHAGDDVARLGDRLDARGRGRAVPAGLPAATAQNTAARANRMATTMISGCGPPAIVTVSGPRSA